MKLGTRNEQWAAAIGTSVILLWLSSACGGGASGTVTEEAARAALPAMVLQPEEIPAGLQPLGGEFSTNEDAVSGLGGGPTLEQLEQWGRLLGYKSDYQASEPADATAITAVSSSASLYKRVGGAADSLTDREAQARAADWRQAHSAFEEFEQQELSRDLPADQALWLRFTGYQELRPGGRNLVVDDQIVFRVESGWGFVGVVSTAAEGEDDRNVMLAEIEVLVREQIQHMKDAFKSGALK